MIKIIGIILALVISASAFGSYIIPSGGVTTVKIAAQAVTQAKLAPRAAVSPSPSTTPSVAGSFATSGTIGPTGLFTCSTGCSSSYTQVTNLEVGLTTTGRPVEVELLSDNSGSAALVGSGASTVCYLEILNGSNAIATLYLPSNNGTPASTIRIIDYPTAGNQSYSVKVVEGVGTGGCTIGYAVLVAHEL